MLAGCAASPPPPPPPSVWGDVVVAGTTEQTSAPALIAAGERTTLAWVGAGGAGVHHDAVAILNGSISPVVTLPLPPVSPRNSRLFPAASVRNGHLLWLDVDNDGVSQLFTALVDESLGIFRGPLAVSESGALCFDGFRRQDGGVDVLWASVDDTLHGATIDPGGRVLRVRELMDNAGCPAVTRTFDAPYVLWQSDDALFAGRFVGAGLLDVLAVAEAPAYGEADRIRELRAGSDGTRLYTFWNISRADSTDETWFTGGLPGEMWPAPRRLTVTPDETARFDTTLNTGITFTATESANGFMTAWAAPLRGVTGVLPVAAEINGDRLSIIYLQNGAVVGYQEVLPARPLLGSPELQLDTDRHLYLTWGEPTEVGPAQMKLTSTRDLLSENVR
ncbi:MAG: hypothetical protein AAF787_14645 [Chloroflexota bacterium]